MLRIHLFVALFGASLAIACSKQGEGERCDPNSGSLDCETGLICRPGDQLSIVGRGVALCCPPDDVQPSVSACQAGAVLPPEPDAGTLLPAVPGVDAATGDGGS
jgi:hypothetical protein